MMAYYLRRALRLLTQHIDAPLLGAVLLLMGVGLVVVTEEGNADDVIAGAAAQGVPAWRLGAATKGSGKVILSGGSD